MQPENKRWPRLQAPPLPMPDLDAIERQQEILRAVLYDLKPGSEADAVRAVLERVERA